MSDKSKVVEEFKSSVSIACESLIKCAKEQPSKTSKEVAAVLQFLSIVEGLTKETREALNACFKAQEILKAKIQQQSADTWEDL